LIKVNYVCGRTLILLRLRLLADLPLVPANICFAGDSGYSVTGLMRTRGGLLRYARDDAVKG